VTPILAPMAPSPRRSAPGALPGAPVVQLEEVARRGHVEGVGIELAAQPSQQLGISGVRGVGQRREQARVAVRATAVLVVPPWSTGGDCAGVVGDQLNPGGPGRQRHRCAVRSGQPHPVPSPRLGPGGLDRVPPGGDEGPGRCRSGWSPGRGCRPDPGPRSRRRRRAGRRRWWRRSACRPPRPPGCSPRCATSGRPRRSRSTGGG
jgi:hypothetical protein